MVYGRFFRLSRCDPAILQVATAFYDSQTHHRVVSILLPYFLAIMRSHTRRTGSISMCRAPLHHSSLRPSSLEGLSMHQLSHCLLVVAQLPGPIWALSRSGPTLIFDISMFPHIYFQLPHSPHDFLNQIWNNLVHVPYLYGVSLLVFSAYI